MSGTVVVFPKAGVCALPVWVLPSRKRNGKLQMSSHKRASEVYKPESSTFCPSMIDLVVRSFCELAPSGPLNFPAHVGFVGFCAIYGPF